MLFISYCESGDAHNVLMMSHLKCSQDDDIVLYET